MSPKTAFTAAAQKDTPKLRRYAASACGEKTVSENSAQDSSLLLMKVAARGMMTIRLK
jgi:hypothetical protein